MKSSRGTEKLVENKQRVPASELVNLWIQDGRGTVLTNARNTRNARLGWNEMISDFRNITKKI